MRKVRINILSPGRFHVCDLARELDKNGFDVRFYSFVPTSRVKKFGLPARCNASVIGFMLPFLFLERILFKRFGWAKRLRIKVQDVLTGVYMRKCDVLIAMSGDFLYSLKKAKSQGSVVILERGSKHILEQRRILESIPSLKGTKPVPNINVKHELEGYELADYISVASQHVVDSFLLYDYPKEKLFKNPYGVDLSMFVPQPKIEKIYDFIMVGGWSYRKGCDLIIEAIKKTQYSLLHIGSIVDMKFPVEKQFTHIDSVDQFQLVAYYAQARIFVLPSREDGFGMVLSQALACNLPLIGSKDCGAPDLKEMVELPQYIDILSEYTPLALVKVMDKMMALYPTLGERMYSGEAVNELSWEAYGKRYAAFLNSIINQSR